SFGRRSCGLRRPRQGPRGTHRHGHVDDLCGDARDPLKIAKAVRGPPEHALQPALIRDLSLDDHGLAVTAHALNYRHLRGSQNLRRGSMRGSTDAQGLMIDHPEVGHPATTRTLA